MKHQFETLPEKLYRMFGERDFSPGAFYFKYGNELYPIRYLKPGIMGYGDSGFHLRATDDSQFIVTDVTNRRKGLKSTCTITIIERRRYLENGPSRRTT